MMSIQDLSDLLNSPILRSLSYDEFIITLNINPVHLTSFLESFTHIGIDNVYMYLQNNKTITLSSLALKLKLDVNVPFFPLKENNAEGVTFNDTNFANQPAPNNLNLNYGQHVKTLTNTSKKRSSDAHKVEVSVNSGAIKKAKTQVKSKLSDVDMRYSATPLTLTKLSEILAVDLKNVLTNTQIYAKLEMPANALNVILNQILFKGKKLTLSLLRTYRLDYTLKEIAENKFDVTLPLYEIGLCKKKLKFLSIISISNQLTKDKVVEKQCNTIAQALKVDQSQLNSYLSNFKHNDRILTISGFRKIITNSNLTLEDIARENFYDPDYSLFHEKQTKNIDTPSTRIRHSNETLQNNSRFAISTIVIPVIEQPVSNNLKIDFLLNHPYEIQEGNFGNANYYKDQTASLYNNSYKPKSGYPQILLNNSLFYPSQKRIYALPNTFVQQNTCPIDHDFSAIVAGEPKSYHMDTQPFSKMQNKTVFNPIPNLNSKNLPIEDSVNSHVKELTHLTNTLPNNNVDRAKQPYFANIPALPDKIPCKTPQQDLAGNHPNSFFPNHETSGNSNHFQPSTNTPFWAKYR